MYKIYLYLYGIYQALLGRYPYKELEHLDYLQVQLSNDDRWLSSIMGANKITQRHLNMSRNDYRAIKHTHISDFREELKQEIKAFVKLWKERNND